MNKFVVMSLFFFIFITLGCSNNNLIGEKSPKFLLKINKEMYETTLGTYCWNGNCVDAIEPLELLEGKETIKVKPNENIKLEMDDESKPDEYRMVEMIDGKENDIKLKNNRFIAPKEKGIYYYSYTVWWTDKEKTNVSQGDATYIFSLEVI